MDSSVDRIALNVFIERLIDSGGQDEEARHAVAQFGRKLPNTKSVQMEGTMTRPGSKFSGQTPQHGTVQVQDKDQETKEFSMGVERERIGYYKVWRQQMKDDNWIVISYFWKADEGTESDTELPQEWALALDQAEQPLWFGERGMKSLFAFNITRFVSIQVDREIFVESWGPEVGAGHKGAIAIRAYVNMSKK